MNASSRRDSQCFIRAQFRFVLASSLPFSLRGDAFDFPPLLSPALAARVDHQLFQRFPKVSIPEQFLWIKVILHIVGKSVHVSAADLATKSSNPCQEASAWKRGWQVFALPAGNNNMNLRRDDGQQYAGRRAWWLCYVQFVAWPYA